MQKSTVIVFLPAALTESFEIVLARACDIRDSGEDVTLAHCTGDFRGCVANPYGWSALCKHCNSVASQAIKAVLPGVHVENFGRVVGDNAPKGAIAETIINGPRSTILTFYRQDINKLNWKYINSFLLRGLFKRFKRYEFSTYLFAKDLINKTKPKRVEFFNGRITPTMSISQSAIDSGVSFCAIEVSGLCKTFFLAENTKVHDLEFLKDRIKNYKPSLVAEELGIEFFQNRRNGLRTNDKSYTNNQYTGLFCKGSKKVVAVFLSSTDEFEIFGDEWFTDFSRNPSAFVLGLRELLEPEYEIVVRMHPNQSGDRTGISERIVKDLSKCDGVVLIRPKDKHSSYELLDIASFVITFGSTIGLEATYWGKPSILAGRCAWEGENVAYVVRNVGEVINIIGSKPEPLDAAKAVKIAAYYMDKHNDTVNLSYENGGGVFKVRGFNFLPQKRKSIYYLFNRAFDKIFIR